MSSLSLVNIYAAAPATERGHPTVLHTDKKGEKLVYGCNNVVFIRDLKNPLQTEIYTEHAHPVTVARFSPSGFYICSGDAGGNVRIWATDNADKTLKLELRPLSGAIKDIAWSDDSKRIVVVGDGKDAFAHVFIWDSGSTIGTISGHSKCILSCDWKQTRPYRIATASEDFLVNFYEGPPFKFAHSNKGHTRFANCVRFSPDGSKLVSVGSDIKIITYDGKTGQPTGEITDASAPHKSAIYSVSWAPDGKQIITASADKTVKLWDTETNTLKTTFTFASNDTDYMQVAALWAGQYMVSLGLNGDLNFLDVANPSQPKITYGHNKLITCLTYDKATNTLYSGSYDGVIIAWEVGVGSKGKFLGKGPTSSISAMSVVDDNLVVASKDDTIRVTSTTTRQYTDQFATVEGTPADLVVGKKDTSLYVTVTSKSIAVLRNGSVINVTDVKYTPTSVDISNDDSTIVVGATDNKLHFYTLDASTGAVSENGVAEGHRGQITKVRYSPDGTMIASSDSNREIIVFDASSRAVKYEGLVFHSGRITALAWNPSSSKLVSGGVDTNVIVWNLAENTRLMAKSAHQGGVNGVVFIDENTIASAGGDCCVKTFKF